jgi:hypothetical protein
MRSKLMLSDMASASASDRALAGMIPSRESASCAFKAPKSQSSTTSARAPATENSCRGPLDRPKACAVSPRTRHSSSSRFSRTKPRTRASNVSYSNGLVRKSSAPTSSPCSRSVGSPSAVTITTGMWVVMLSDLRRRQVW